MTGWFRRLRARLRYRTFDADLQRELEEHRRMSQAAFEAEGLSPADARLRAAHALGNATLARETARGVWIAPWLESVWQDTRYAVRGLRASPSFTLPALAALVITMGLTTSLFATIESILFRPWPVPDADRVVSVITTQRRGDHVVYATGTVEYRYLRDHARAVDLAALTSMSLPLGSGQTPASTVRLVSGNYFSVLQVPVVAGRPIGPDDDDEGAAAAAVISHGFWQRQFGGSTNVIGSTLQVADVPFTVVGIAARGAVDSPTEPAPDAWIPLAARAMVPPGLEPTHRAFLEDARGCCLAIVGRLARGADTRSADSEVRLLASQFARTHAIDPLETAVRSTALINDPMAQRGARIQTLLTLATTLLVLLGAANVGNLQVARGMARRRDTAVRLALGGSRGRLVRQLLTEGLVLALTAAAASLLVAHWLPALILPASAPPVSLAAPTFAFAIALAAVVCLMSSLLPAVKATQVNLRVREAGVSRSRLRSGLLGLQVAISAVLLAGTGLLVRGVHHAAGAGLGFNPDRVAAVSLGLPTEGHSPSEREELALRAVDALTKAGRGPAAATSSVPFSGYRTSSVRAADGDRRNQSRAVAHRVTADYFQVLGVPVIAGAPLTSAMAEDAVVVNESLARLLWPGPVAGAVGRVLLDGDRARRVAGVVADLRTELVERTWPAYYDRSGPFSALLVRNDPRAVAAAQDAIRALAPMASPSVLDFRRRLRQQLEPSMQGAAVAGAISLLALVLAGIGTLGVVSYVVNERTREIGVRMALGARARDIISVLARRMSWPLVGGLAVGVIAAHILGGAIRGYLYGVSPHDPATYTGVILVLVVAAIVATFVPLRRALRVDPAVTLRHD